MSDVFIAFILAAGVAAWVYSKMGRRVGYGNAQSVWSLVGITFGLVFVMVLVLLKFVINLHQ